MFIRLLLVGVVIASSCHHVTGYGTQESKLFEYFWNYVQYVSFLETSVEEASLATYSSVESLFMDQQHGNTPSTGELHRLSSTIRNFQQYLNIPSREHFPHFNAEGTAMTPCDMMNEQICRPFDCATAEGDPKRARRIDGKCNNVEHPLWGSAITPQTRFLPGYWESVAKSPSYDLVNNIFTDTKFLGAVDDFQEPFIFKVKGSGKFLLAGYDTSGSVSETTVTNCTEGCTVAYGAISGVEPMTDGCTASFQRLSNVLYAEEDGCESAEYRVSYYLYTFLLELQPASSKEESSLTVFGESSEYSSKNKFEVEDRTPYWLKLDDNRVSVSSGTEYSADDVFLAVVLDNALKEPSVGVAGDGSTVQFVSRDVYQIHTDDFNTPVSLDNIPYTYAHYNLRVGIQNMDQAELRLIGKSGTSSEGVWIHIKLDGHTLIIHDNRDGETVVEESGITTLPDFVTAAGDVYSNHIAVWFAWYGREFFVGYGNSVGYDTIAVHEYDAEEFWFKIGSVQIGSTTETGWVFDIEQLGTPRKSSRSTADPLASAMDVAQLVHKRTTDEVKWSSNLTMATFQYGQFLDHDFIATPTISINGHSPICCSNGKHVDDGVYSDDACYNIEVTTERITENEMAPFNASLTECLGFVRSTTILDCSSKDSDDRQPNPINAITSYIDGSNVYGSDEATLESVRDGETCYLLIDNGELPLAEHGGEACVPNARCRHAGDFRSQEQPMLAATHTLFVREHNRLAKKMIDENGYANDDECFNAVKNIVIAEIQIITEDGFLPSFLSEKVLSQYNVEKGDNTCRYDSSINGGMTAEFGIVYRMGHSWISDNLGGKYNHNHHADDLFLAHNFFNPAFTNAPGGSSNVLRGMSHACPGSDRIMEASVTGSLFGNLGPASNLAALNIQRGRDHGVPTLAEMREYLGLSVPQTISDLKGLVDDDTIATLQRIYNSIDDIDLFTAALIEDHMAGSTVGPIINEVMARQMELLKKGDRFWYTCYFTEQAVQELQKVTLGRILCDNADGLEIQQDVFRQESPTNPATPCLKRPEMDLSHFRPDNNGGRAPGFGDDIL